MRSDPTASRTLGEKDSLRSEEENLSAWWLPRYCLASCPGSAAQEGTGSGEPPMIPGLGVLASGAYRLRPAEEFRSRPLPRIRAVEYSWE